MQTLLKRQAIGLDATRSFVSKVYTRWLKNNSNFHLYLEGGLGSGKTFCTQELLKLYGITDPITSPTYTLVQEYTTPSGQKLAHFDLYRLEDPNEFFARGFHEIAQDPEVLCFVEWPERLSDEGKASFSGTRMALLLKHGTGVSMRDIAFISD